MVYVLVNTGGVARFLEYPVFLFRMFRDPRILPLPEPLRSAVSLSIALFRAPLAYGRYRAIGGSPILDIMRRQARGLERASGASVRYACLYSSPLLGEVLKGCEEAVVIPQYPHFSTTTTGSVLDAVRAAGINARVVLRYWMLEEFVSMWVEAIERVWDGEHLLFVAHGVPMSVINRGDPYYREVLASCRLIASCLGVKDYRVAFQSRMGPFEWTRPYLEEVLGDLLMEGIKRVLVVPVSFVNEHLETLYDLDVDAPRLALSMGFEVYKRVPVPWNSEWLYRCWMRAAEVEDCTMLL